MHQIQIRLSNGARFSDSSEAQRREFCVGVIRRCAIPNPIWSVICSCIRHSSAVRSLALVESLMIQQIPSTALGISLTNLVLGSSRHAEPSLFNFRKNSSMMDTIAWTRPRRLSNAHRFQSFPTTQILCYWILCSWKVTDAKSVHMCALSTVFTSSYS